MRKYIILCLVFAFLMISAAAEEMYIVYFGETPALFQNGGGTGRNYCSATYDELMEYLAAGIVEDYELDYEIELYESFTASDASAWNLDAIGAVKAEQIGCLGQGITVGVIDSGVYAHAELSDNLVSGHSYVDASDDTNDNMGHGTFVSGIIESIAGGVNIVPLKCFDSGKTTITCMISDAIYDAVDVYGCDVINMSFGIPKSQITTALKLAVEHALQSGCILVAAVGNSNSSTVYYPANYDGVIGVGSVDKNGERSWFSQYNATVDFMAPGEGIDGIKIPGFTSDSGTSFAAPHVSALAAVAKCIDENINAKAFSSSLEAVCRQREDYEYSVYTGHGSVNAVGMIDELLKDTEIFVSPVYKNNGLYTSVVYNNTNTEKNLVAFAATYKNGGVLADFALTSHALFSKAAQPITLAASGDEISISVWKDLQTLVPYTNYRRFK